MSSKTWTKISIFKILNHKAFSCSLTAGAAAISSMLLAQNYILTVEVSPKPEHARPQTGLQEVIN